MLDRGASYGSLNSCFDQTYPDRAAGLGPFPRASQVLRFWNDPNCISGYRP